MPNLTKKKITVVIEAKKKRLKRSEKKKSEKFVINKEIKQKKIRTS